MQPVISEYYLDRDGGIRLFITGADRELSSEDMSVLAGVEECSIMSKGYVTENTHVRTLLMVDNSRSVPGFTRVKQLLHQIITGHAEGEEFYLATFDSELTPAGGAPDDFSPDYDRLILAADNLEQADLSTNVNAALLQALKLASDDGSLYRIIVISDGGDFVKTGPVTAEEVEEQLEKTPVLLHTVGILWDSAGAYGLEDMALLGRRYGSYHSLDEEGASAAIGESLSQDYNTFYLDAALPAGTQDGSIKSIMVEFSADSSYISRDIRMPQRAVPSPTVSPVPQRTAAPTPFPVRQITEIPTEAATEYSGGFSFGKTFKNHAILSAGIIIVLASACAAAYLVLHSRKKSSAKLPEEQEEISDYESTELFMGQQENVRESYETQLMFAKPAERSVIHISLVHTKDPGNVLEADLTGSMILGSSGHYSEIVVEGDPTVSRRHARLTQEGTRVLLEDLDSTNGTWLNREPLHGSREIQNGDLLRFGDTELTVRLVTGAGEDEGIPD